MEKQEGLDSRPRWFRKLFVSLMTTIFYLLLFGGFILNYIFGIENNWLYSYNKVVCYLSISYWIYVNIKFFLRSKEEDDKIIAHCRAKFLKDE